MPYYYYVKYWNSEAIEERENLIYSNGISVSTSFRFQDDDDDEGVEEEEEGEEINKWAVIF